MFLPAEARRALDTAKGRDYFRTLADAWVPDDDVLRRDLALIARRTLDEILSQSPDDQEARHAAG